MDNNSSETGRSLKTLRGRLALHPRVSIRVIVDAGEKSVLKHRSNRIPVPPEILYSILLEMTLRYFTDVYSDALESRDPHFKRFAENPVPANLQVSRQHRETMLKVLLDTLGIESGPDGLLAPDSWKCFKDVRQALHMARTGERTSFDALVSEMNLSESYGPVPKTYLAFARYELSTREALERTTDNGADVIVDRALRAAREFSAVTNELMDRQSVLDLWLLLGLHTRVAERIFILFELGCTIKAVLHHLVGAEWFVQSPLKQRILFVTEQTVVKWAAQEDQLSTSSSNLSTIFYYLHDVPPPTENVVSAQALRVGFHLLSCLIKSHRHQMTGVITLLRSILDHRDFFDTEKIIDTSQMLLDRWSPILERDEEAV
ncbi:hypothetical protein OBBRIDRAFT_245403 [Obba rivulosa]|uniref:Uncharacterized protein n=1 Tax=Obba rivulosa TaxID=1052685 RepID=A0A8E2AQN9_9APHY|nr:hypothetical protein OBBRIDRAFT_245403 [Obba rivulosa]